jgi:RNA polymerase sigma-70 factor (ECF subfamily)
MSSSLLVRVKAQDRAAWDRLIDLYTPLVWHWCRAAGLQHADAQDVGQEVFKAVWRAVGDYRRDRPGDTFLGWLRTITRNKIMDRHRRKPAEAVPGGSEELTRMYEVPAPDPSGSDPAADGTEAAQVYHRAAELIRAEFQEKTWLAFRALVIEGRAAADVAGELGMTVNAVYLAKARVLKRLREEFDGLIET